jgi:hypothetical protein
MILSRRQLFDLRRKYRGGVPMAEIELFGFLPTLASSLLAELSLVYGSASQVPLVLSPPPILTDNEFEDERDGDVVCSVRSMSLSRRLM